MGLEKFAASVVDCTVCSILEVAGSLAGSEALKKELEVNSTSIRNPFAQHLGNSGQTYWSHLLFTVHISVRLAVSAFLFVLHGILPIIPIPRQFNLEAVASFLLQKNHAIETLKQAILSLTTTEIERLPNLSRTKSSGCNDDSPFAQRPLGKRYVDAHR
ncbi:MAG: hypothetical protein KME30_32300 [Iphinoe sp. HA4291-MV1]|jgi:hypothetical protein|nr:hypothetical protein [Iphinoe sp. HA4291-MV1]